jgi:glucosylceramidase
VPVITLDPSTRFQTLWGFGGAITDSVAHVFSQLNATLQQQVVNDLWGAEGQRYNLGRLTIGATDFSVSVYSYNDHASDYDQGNFSIKHDEDRIIPLALRAQQVDPTQPIQLNPRHHLCACCVMQCAGGGGGRRRRPAVHVVVVLTYS